MRELNEAIARLEASADALVEPRKRLEEGGEWAKSSQAMLADCVALAEENAALAAENVRSLEEVVQMLAKLLPPRPPARRGQPAAVRSVEAVAKRKAA